MATITVYVDDSAEERRRRRRRIIEIVIILALLGGVAAARRPTNPSTPKPIMLTKIVEVPVPQYWSFDPPGPYSPPRAAIAPSQVEFESLPVGGSGTKLVTIRNSGGYHLDVALRVQGDGFGITHSCGKGLNEREVCAAEVVFAPRREGRYSGELTVTAREEVTTVALSGSATDIREPPPDPKFRLSPYLPTPWPDVTISVQWDTVQPQKALTVQVDPRKLHFIRPGSKRVIVSNPHDEPIRIHRIVLEGDGYALKDDEKCTTLLNPGQSCTFSVVAKPVSGYTPQARLTIE